MATKLLQAFFFGAIFNTLLFAKNAPTPDPNEPWYQRLLFKPLERPNQEPSPKPKPKPKAKPKSMSFHDKIDRLPVSAETKKRLSEEREAFKKSDKTNVSQAIIDNINYVATSSWEKTNPDNPSISYAKQILNKNHYGLEKVKGRILDFIAVQHLNKNAKIPVLCLVGPPGIGKTSLSKSISHSLKRKHGNISLDSIHNPERILQAIEKTGSDNSIMLIDEIDKILCISGSDVRISKAFDPEQNKKFYCESLNIPFDLSKIMFIATVNDKNNIPKSLLNHMEVIELSDYSNEQKVQIAQQHLIKKAIEEAGLKDKGVHISNKVLQKLITGYTQEAGVRQLEHTLNTLCSKIARGLVEKNELISITANNLEKHLGPQMFIEEKLIGQKIDSLPVSAQIKEQIRNEAGDLTSQSFMDNNETVSEHRKVRLRHLSYIFSLPWGKTTKDNLSITHAKHTLDKGHFGLEKAKEKILDFIAIRNLKKDAVSPILCLVGPPGTGKTSIGKSIARSLGRKYGRIVLAGLKNAEDIRGNAKMYIGSTPGRLIQIIKNTGSCNPVILLDEIDKMSSSADGPTAAMLEVLDPEHNKEFHDNYLGVVPFDLSKIIFVATANDISTMPRPLHDRMEIIEVNGYTDEEKVQIAQQHLIKKAIEESGLKDKGVHISNKVLQKLITNYTQESGVRQLGRTLKTLCSKMARVLVEKNELISITAQNLEEHLGPPMFMRKRD